jgi:hypothetical protein
VFGSFVWKIFVAIKADNVKASMMCMELALGITLAYSTK